jgi:hypothetical protein
MLTRRNSALLVLALMVMGFVGACSGGDDDSSAGGGDGAVNRKAPAAEPDLMTEEQGLSNDSNTTFGGVNDGGGGGDTGTASDIGLPGTPPRVIKTADIRIDVPKDEFRDSVQASVDVAERNGGFVNSTTVNEDNKSGSVTIRVPAESFEAALGELKQIGDVEAETISGTDVTQEFVDLEARKRNLEAQETVLLNLMDDATSVLATIRVQRELQPVQLEIERLQGRINYLSDQTDMSTITVAFTPAGAAPTEPAGAIEKAWANAKDTFVAVVSAVVIGAGFVIPVAFLLALVALAVRWLRPRFTA